MGFATHAQVDRKLCKESSGLVDITANAQIPEHSLVTAALLKLRAGDDEGFDTLARNAFEYQSASSPVYRIFAEGHSWDSWEGVPFLPVEAFKWPGIVPFNEEEADALFVSSATGGRRSRHPVASIQHYDTLAGTWFKQCVGSGPFALLAHLPTYEALGDQSSLIHMVRKIIDDFGDAESAIIPTLDELAAHVEALKIDDDGSNQVLLFGTAFGLLDYVEAGGPQLPEGSLVVETGGMKTRRREINRRTLHGTLADHLGLKRSSIRSEYGMCELLSQFYTTGGETFACPPWVRTMVVDPDDATSKLDDGQPGLLAIFDLANWFSVCPILTQDLAVKTGDRIEILGRVEGAELRGCNFLFERA